jgi:hypothetical protein
MSKSVALFSTFCNSEEKINVLADNIKKVKSLGLDAIVITPFLIDPIIYELADSVITTKENPIDLYDKSIVIWKMGFRKNYIEPSGDIFNILIPDYGYASGVQMKRLIDYSLSFNYDNYHIIIYDLLINDEVEKILVEGRECSFFKNDRIVDSIGGTFVSFNKENAKIYSSLVRPQSYYYNMEDTGEKWLEKIQIAMGGNLEDLVVTDTIKTGDDDAFLIDHTPDFNFSTFIVKWDFLDLYFYNVFNDTEIDIEINGVTTRNIIKESGSIRILDNIKDFRSASITRNGIKEDITGKVLGLFKTEIKKT